MNTCVLIVAALLISALVVYFASYSPEKKAGGQSFSVRVREFDTEARAYIVEYRSGISWHTITQACTWFDTLSLIKRDHPVLFYRFEEAEEFAKKFPTMDDVLRYAEQEDAKYKQKVDELSARIDARKKTKVIY